MKQHIWVTLLLILLPICACTYSGPQSSGTASTSPEKPTLPISAANEELKARGQVLHDSLEYHVVEKDWGWFVTVGNLSARQPKGHTYIPGDAVLIRVSKDGKVLEYEHVP